MADAAPTEAVAAAPAAAAAASSAPKVNKTTVGTKVKAKASLVTHDSECQRVFGPRWNYVNLPGKVVSVEKRYPNRNSKVRQTYIRTSSFNEESTTPSAATMGMAPSIKSRLCGVIEIDDTL